MLDHNRQPELLNSFESAQLISHFATDTNRLQPFGHAHSLFVLAQMCSLVTCDGEQIMSYPNESG